MSACLSPTHCSPFFEGGLALYVTLVARSGVGKKRYTFGPREIVKAISFMLVSEKEPSSDVGMFSLLRKCPSRIFCYDEYKQSMMKMLEGSSAQQGIVRVFLSAFDCPKIMDGSATKNIIDSTSPIARPNVTKIGGCTIDAFAKLARMEAYREDGLLGRDEIVVVNEIIVPEFDEQCQESPLDENILFVYQKAASLAIKTINDNEIIDAMLLQPTKKNPFPDTHNDIVFPKRTPFTIEQTAKERWISLAKNERIQAQIDGGSHGALSNRKPERIMRIACCLAAFRFSNEVSEMDLDFATMLVHENCMNSRNIIDISEQENPQAELIEKIVQALREIKEPTSWAKILEKDSKLKHCRGSILDFARRSAEENGEIIITKKLTTGRPAMILSLPEWSKVEDSKTYLLNE
jgi:hypothetical protein